MKINDKSLATYACSKDGIDKEGSLNKKGEVNHGYKKRWFVLKGNLLFYFEKQNDKQPLGMIVLENCSVEVSDNERYSFCVRYQAFGTVGASRTYILQAESEAHMEKWMKCITSASYCYAEMVVKEFEKTLERLQAVTKNTCTENNINNTKRQTLLSQVEDMSNIDSTVHLDNTDSCPSIKKSTSNASVLAETDVKVKIKPPLDMYTLTTASNAKTKFKTLNTIRRSKSSENVNKIQTAGGRSPNPKRKSKIQTLKRQNFVAVPNSDTTVAYEFERTTFDMLHTSFGAAIWTKIGETL